ncbi:MAG TPA: hypothetical protein VFO34_07975, partial [Candidatus Acidoferrales bacterium]|nr:hypothetical protein [Candidatus Acidoferrales bacterium]
LLASSESAFAQGCSQCLTYASAAGKKAQASLDLGIGVLLIPTLFLFSGILLLFVWRARAASAAMESAADVSADRKLPASAPLLVRRQET